MYTDTLPMQLATRLTIASGTATRNSHNRKHAVSSGLFPNTCTNCDLRGGKNTKNSRRTALA